MGNNIRRLQAAHEYCKQVYILKNIEYTWIQALKDQKYGERYIHSHAANMWRDVAIKEVIAEYRAKSEGEAVDKIEEIRLDHKRLQALGEKKGDLATATANAQLYGKTYAAYTDVHEARDGELRLTEAEWQALHAEEAETRAKIVNFGDAIAV